MVYSFMPSIRFWSFGISGLLTRIGGALSGPIPLGLRLLGRRSRAMRYAAAELRSAITGTRTARLGTLLQRRGLRQLSSRLDAEMAVLAREATGNADYVEVLREDDANHPPTEQAMLDAANTIKPQLERFYSSLSDEQKAHLNIMRAS